uniref:H-2 class II histocompatibility antigen, A-Q alpha chain-like n=1 Tax=Astyanax mexicanus TaxID=7994 RepID=A0A3B1IVT4_ASTMX
MFLTCLHFINKHDYPLNTILYLSCLIYNFLHRDISLILCSETDREQIYGLDGEEMWHADFRLEKGVMTLPQFADPYSYVEGTYEGAVSNIETCKSNLAILFIVVVGLSDHLPVYNDPHVSVYSKDDVVLGYKNTLICYISGFYPAHVGVSWTRNNVNVTDEASLSRYYVNDDGSFNLVSALSFTPEEGDIYTLPLWRHGALERPYDQNMGDVQAELPDAGVGASVFCGVGLAAGLLGVAVGTFFLVKGNNCN